MKILDPTDPTYIELYMASSCGMKILDRRRVLVVETVAQEAADERCLADLGRASRTLAEPSRTMR